MKITRAQNKVKNGSDLKKKKSKKLETTSLKRTWLTNVDYKNGGLLSDKKKNSKQHSKDTSNDVDDESFLPKKKKSKFLSKFHREEHDNIFSKKFKQNKLTVDKRKKK